MANSYLKPDAITKEALRILHNSLPFVMNIDKQHDKETTFGGQKRGASIRIRKPNQYTVRSGWTINVQDQDEQSDTLTIGTPLGVDMQFSDADLALEIDEFSRRFIAPAVKRLASEVDLQTFQSMYQQVYNQVGTAGTTPATALVYLQANQKLNEFAVPEDMRSVIINPAAQASTVDGLKALFNPQSNIANQYLKGMMSGAALGFEGWYMSQNVPLHTTGTRSGTILIDGTVSTEGSTTIHIDGLGGATQTITAGDVFTVADVYSVNPETKQSTGQLQQFVVTAAATAAGSEVDLTVSPAMYTSASGGLQTITAFPVDEAAVTFVGTASTSYAQNMAFHKEAFTFASAQLEMPSDVSFKSQVESDGLNIRILRQYDINNANYPCRMDIFFGSLAQRPEMACRITG